MSHTSKSAGIEPVVARSTAYTAFGKALRLYVGRGCRFSYKELERKAGVPARMIEAYRYEPDHEEWRPAPFEHVLSLSAALGPDFTSDWMALADQGAFWLPDDGGTPPGELAADNADDNADLTRRASDGSFKGDERHLKSIGSRMVSRGAHLVAIGSKAA